MKVLVLFAGLVALGSPVAAQHRGIVHSPYYQSYIRPLPSLPRIPSDAEYRDQRLANEQLANAERDLSRLQRQNDEILRAIERQEDSAEDARIDALIASAEALLDK